MIVSSGPTSSGAPQPPHLQDLIFHHITAVPLRHDSQRRNSPAQLAGPRDPTRAYLLAAIVGAHAEKSPVAVVWTRATAGGPIRIFAGKRTGFGYGQAASDGTATLLFPPGGRGRPSTAPDVLAQFSALGAWVRCGGIHDPLVAINDRSIESQLRGPFEEYVSALSGEAFAWVVVGEPVEARDLDRELARLWKEIKFSRGNSDDDMERLRELERLESRYREFSRVRVAGAWTLHVMVGAAHESAARRIATLLCSGSDLAHLPYLLVPDQEVGSFETIYHRIIGARTEEAACSPFRATGELLCAIARPPERELSGIRLVAPPTFDVTPEDADTVKRGGSAIPLGDILDENLRKTAPFAVGQSTLNRHTFVCGATGSGKSQTVRTLLEELSKAGIPWLVIEPAKAEYARMAGRLSDEAVCVLRPGKVDCPPAGLNPLEPEEGFPLQTHIDLVRSLFLAAFDAEDPLPQVLMSALMRCYADLGWDLALGASRYDHGAPRYPTLYDLQQTARSVVESIGYSQRVTDDVRGFIDVRLGSLRLGTPGRIFEGGHPLDIGGLLKRNVVIEIENVGDDQDKAFVMGIFLIRVIEHLRLHRQDQGDDVTLQHVTVVEEAHRLLKNALPGTQVARAIELFASLLAEVRAYGEGIVVAEQIPSKILIDVIKNTALKVMHRLPAQDDRDSVGATMNLDVDQSRYAVTLLPGQAALFSDGMDRPVLAEILYRGNAERAALHPPTVPIREARSLACHEDCRRGAYCELERITHASWLVDNPHDMRLSLWIEMFVVAHLIGMSRPVPDPAWLKELCSKPMHDLACAIGQCIQAALDARYAAIIPFYRPEDDYQPGKNLLTHIRDAVIARVYDQTPKCNMRGEVRFQAGPYRWNDIKIDLQTEQGMSDRHPATDDWQRKRGLDLAGNNVSEQLQLLIARPESTLPSDAIIYGVVTPARLERAIERHGGHKRTWEARLAEATRFLTFPNNTPGTKIWPLRYMKQRRPIAEERRRS